MTNSKMNVLDNEIAFIDENDISAKTLPGHIS
jgi:hypothetical protein